MPMLNVIRFLSAAAVTSPTNPFSSAWAQTAFANSIADLTAAMQSVYALPTKHLTEVFYNLSDEYRRYFHAQCIQLSEAVATDMAELSLTAALLRWITQAALPALQPLPENASMNTAEIMRKNYSPLDYACLVARPDDSNPEFQKMTARIASLEREVIAEQKKTKASQQPLPVNAGVDTAVNTDDLPSRDASGASKYKVTAIALGVALAAAIILVALFVSLYYSKCNKVVYVSSNSGGGGGGGVPTASLSSLSLPPSLGGGGVSGSGDASSSSGKAVLDVLQSYGFSSLVS